MSNIELLNVSSEVKNKARKTILDISRIFASEHMSFDPSRDIEKVCFAIMYMMDEEHDKEEEWLFDEIINSDARINTLVHNNEFNNKNFEKDVLKTIIVSYDNMDELSASSYNESTPASISKLALHLMNIQDTEEVLDLCCGKGSFLTEAYRRNPNPTYYGIDINADLVLAARIRSYVLGNTFNIHLDNAFQKYYSDSRYDKIFANYPFGMRMKEMGRGMDYLLALSDRINTISKATSCDWVFNSLALDLLKENGKAVCISTNGSMFNTIDKAVRKYFIDNGFIEAVVSLPANLFSMTAIPVTMLVLSKGNKEVKFVDGSTFFQKGRRTNSLSDDHINLIVKGTLEKTEYSELIPLDRIAAEDYVLAPSRYLSAYLEKLTVKDGKPFGDVIKSITRGASIRAEELDKLSVYRETDYQYLMLSNIQNGIIDKDLPYLSAIEPSLDKYCLKENNLILSKNGYPYKVAVVGKSQKKILANGNLFIIELDEEQANPYYIKALFESEKGIALLKSITVGATIPNIGVNELKKLVIPVPSLEEQKKIADKFQEVEDEIKLLQLRIQKAIARKNQVFEDETED